LDFVVSGLETPAAAAGFLPNSTVASNGVQNTTSNGFWQVPVVNAGQFRVVVDVPGSFTGTANVGIRCMAASYTIGFRRIGPYAVATPSPVPSGSLFDHLVCSTPVSCSPSAGPSPAIACASCVSTTPAPTATTTPCGVGPSITGSWPYVFHFDTAGCTTGGGAALSTDSRRAE